MVPIKFLLLLMPLFATTTQGFLQKKIHADENENAGGTYVENIKTIVEDVKDAIHLKKQTVADAVYGAVDTKVGIIKDIKDSKKNMIQSILASKIAKVNAMKTAKEDFMKTIMEQKNPFFFFFQKKPHHVQEVTTLPPDEGLKSQIFNFFHHFFNKFQGHFKKDKFHASSVETPVSYPSSNNYPEVQGMSIGTQDSDSQINFFPSESIAVEAEYPVTETTSAPVEYVQNVQSPYEYGQVEIGHPGFQQNKFSSSLDYNKPREDGFASSQYPAVDFANQQTDSRVHTSYYDSYPTSVKSTRAIYKTLN